MNEPAAPCPPARLVSCRRILVLGSSGAGKSYFSRRLEEVLGIETIHLDRPSQCRRASSRASRTGARFDAPTGQRLDMPFLAYIWRFPKVTRPFVLRGRRRVETYLELVAAR